MIAFDESGRTRCDDGVDDDGQTTLGTRLLGLALLVANVLLIAKLPRR